MSNDSIVVRNGEEKDLDDFFELFWMSSVEHIQYNKELDALKSKEQCKKFIIDRQRKYLSDTKQIFFVAQDNKKIIGAATGHIGPRDEAAVYKVEEMGFLDELCVIPEYRKSGIGKRLVETLLQELDRRAVQFVGLGVAYKNPAMHLYHTYGFHLEGVWMVRRRDQPWNVTEQYATQRGEGKRYDPYGRGKETLPFIVKVKPQSVMGDYIALHGLLPENELPVRFRHKIPENEIWIRKNVYDDPKRRERILQGHEKFELELMETRGLTYKQAHQRAQFHEKVYRLEDWLGRVEKELTGTPYESVQVIEKPTARKKMKHKKRTRSQDT